MTIVLMLTKRIFSHLIIALFITVPLIINPSILVAVEHEGDSANTAQIEKPLAEDEKINTDEEARRIEEEARFREEQRTAREGEERRFTEEEGRRREEGERRFKEEEGRRLQEEERMNEQRFEDMKRGVDNFLRNIERMEHEMNRTTRRLERCKFEVPAWAAETLEEAKKIVSLVEAAQTADALEDIMFELEDIGFKMEDWGPKMGGLHQVCDMLTGAERELKRLERDYERMEMRAQQRKVNVTVMLAKLRELKRAMESAVEQARSLAEDNPEQAVFVLEDEFFFKMESYHNQVGAIEMAIDISRGLRDAEREISEFQKRIERLKEEGEDTRQMQSLLDEMRALKRKIESATASGGFHPEDIGDLIDEAFDIREELSILLAHGDGGKFFDEKDFEEEEFEFEDKFESDFDIPDAFVPDARSRARFEAHEKGGVADRQVQEIKEKATLLNQNKLDQILSELQELRSVVKEQDAELKHLRGLASDLAKVNEETKERLNAFVAYGVDENSKKLGAGERAAVLYSFKSAFRGVPSSEKDVEDMIKIVNGRFPAQRSPVAEKRAKKAFVEIFKRAPNINEAQDQAAIMVMAYGLRQTAQNRKIVSEEQGIKTFRALFNRVPQTTEDWNTMQAITYSGAVRKPDRDKDLLADADELIFGTDPDNKDTDGDGIPDGTEILEGFDPLQK